MPGFLIDGGRLLVVPVIFALSAALAAVGLVPCWFAYHELQRAYGDFVAFLSVPFLYFVWGITYCVAAVVFKWAIVYRPREGRFGLFTWSVVGWGLTGAVTNFANVMFLVHFKGTPLLNVWYRALGMKLGHRVTINSVRLFDWDLITIDDDVVLGGDCVLMAHSLEGGQMQMRPIHIGRGATIGGEAKVMPGCTIGERSILGASSVLTKQSTIPPHELWGGLPARFIKHGKGHPQASSSSSSSSSSSVVSEAP
jgi:non-ribosomal peptide synthetase-like protein